MKSNRVGLYVRVSSLDQNVEMQVRELEQFISARGWTLYRTYEDKMTGTTGKRPSLQSILEDARKRKIDIIVCWKLDRFFRSLRDLVNTLTELHEVGVSFVSLNDPGVDMTTPSGRLLIHLIGAFAEFEVSLTKARVRAGIANAKAKGKHLGRPRVINIEKVIALRQQGLSLNLIAKQLGTTKGTVSKILSKHSRQIELNKSTSTISETSNGVAETKPSETAPESSSQPEVSGE